MQNSSAVESSSVPRSEKLAEPISVAVVDDSEDFRVVVCELIKMLFNVRIVATGANGFEALEIVADHGPDLLIMDVHMPILDGISAAGLISAHFPTTTILMMSGDESPDLQKRCLQNGADAFSPKRTVARQIAQLHSMWM